jgi:colanic acid/amylovoran biosynthesis glycosyltransferase
VTEVVHARRPVAVLLSRFPLITETFILREITEMERQGQSVVLVPMLRERPAVVHREAIPWIARALFTPYVSPAIAMANLQSIVRAPFRYLGTLAGVVRDNWRSPSFLVRSLAIFPKSVYLAGRLRSAGIVHMHAHFATHPATMALIIHRLAPEITYSFTVHAHDIFVNRTGLARRLASAAAVRSISRFNRAFLVALYHELVEAKIEVVHVGIDPSHYEGEAEESGPLRLLCVAALKPYKGVRVLVQACEILKRSGVDFICDVIGQGPLQRSLQHAIDAAGLGERFRLLGALPQHEVAERLRRCAIFVLPSVVAPDGQMEGIPVALMEAMAAKRAVVASSLSGIPELIENGVDGLLVDPNHPEHLAETLRKLFADPALRRSLGEAARLKVQREFSLLTTTEELIGFIDRFNRPLALRPPEGVPVSRPRITAVHETPDSRVVELVADEQPLIAKQPLSREGESRPPRARMIYERDLLVTLKRALPPGAVPEVLGIDEESMTIWMTRASGRRLDGIVRAARWNGSQQEALGETVAAVGVWLRNFHVVQFGISGLSGSAVHGDFWPGNVFVDEGRVTVIDFEGVRSGATDDDLGYFLVHLALYFPPPLQRRFRRLRSRFLGAYFAGETIPMDRIAAAEARAARRLRERISVPTFRGALQRRQLAMFLRRSA